MKRDKLTVAMVTLTIVGIALTGFLFAYTLANREAISESIQKSVQQELSKYNLDDVKHLSIDDSKILLAVARFCESNNNCSGLNGLQGIQGLQGVQGLMGLTGLNGRDGYTPIKGVDYFDGKDGINGQDGEPGQPGSDGRKIVQRCNPDKNRVEWQYEGDENWSPLYNLSPLQTCEEVTI